jgi:DNA replication and repair protein RecF
VRVTAVEIRDFRNYRRAELQLGARLTVVAGPNGSGKTNLLEAVFFGCTGRSPRTTSERELVRHGGHVARVAVTTADDSATHRIEVGLAPGEDKSMHVDGRAVDNLSTATERPLLNVFMPERLELVKGAPAARRRHMDMLVAALWPARAETRVAYSRALAQRNALLSRIRAGAASSASLGSWDLELASRGVELMADRREALALLGPAFSALAADLGLPAPARARYRPRSGAVEAGELAAELRDRRDADIERGFTAHGPHRDDLQLLHGDDALRTFGSQGQQRVALLALLFAERDVLGAERGRAPVMLLDDVMSELDAPRRGLLSELLLSEGQGLITTTDPAQVPAAHHTDVLMVEVADGALRTGGELTTGGVAA